jgi:plastocyanin
MKTGVIISIVIVLLIVLIGGFLLMKPTNNTPINPSNNQTPVNSGNADNSLNIEITNLAFSPSNLTIKKGQTVIWINKDATIRHTVTSDAGSELASDALAKDQTYSHTFNQAGTYNYHCNFHSAMHGFIIVQ